jgi:RimK family alpha-L-glutamate ligase
MEKVNQLKHKPHVYQEFIQSSFGKDIRLHVVGDEVVATMMRKSEIDFRANVTNGGKMYQYTPTEEQAALAVKSAKLLGADFAGVDLLFGENDEPIICEVNSNAHMKNILSCTGVDVSEFIMDYIYKDLEAKR